MSFSHTITEKWASGSRTINKTNTYTGDGQTSLSISVANGQVNFPVDLSLDVSLIKSIYINSDKAVTLETNDGDSPVDTVSLAANKPYIWTEDSYFTNVFDTDITGVFITNNSGSTATVEVEIVYDASLWTS